MIFGGLNHVVAKETEGEVVVGADDAVEGGHNGDCVEEVFNELGGVHFKL